MLWHVYQIRDNPTLIALWSTTVRSSTRLNPVANVTFDSPPLTTFIVAELASSSRSVSPVELTQPFTSGGSHYPEPWGPIQLCFCHYSHPVVGVAWHGPSFHSSPVRWWPRWPRPGPGMNITSVRAALVIHFSLLPLAPLLSSSWSVLARVVRLLARPCSTLVKQATLLLPRSLFFLRLATTRPKRSHKMRIWIRAVRPNRLTELEPSLFPIRRVLHDQVL